MVKGGFSLHAAWGLVACPTLAVILLILIFDFRGISGLGKMSWISQGIALLLVALFCVFLLTAVGASLAIAMILGKKFFVAVGHPKKLSRMQGGNVMEFRPSPGERLTIDGEVYVFEANPAARSFVHAWEGKKGTVYKLRHERTRKFIALKVFHKLYRKKDIEAQSRKLARYETLPGLEVCSRRVLTRNSNSALIGMYPELEFAVLMPFIDGRTWQDVVYDAKPLTPEQSLHFAVAMADVLASMEENRVAHCDVAGSNCILSPDGTYFNAKTQLVDVEDMWAKEFLPPSHLPAGSPGYAFHAAPSSSVWNPAGDRFAGGVILTEMLLSHIKKFCDFKDDISYFSEEETLTQARSERFYVARDLLKAEYPKDLAETFDRAWCAKSLQECPTLHEWRALISPTKMSVPTRESRDQPDTPETSTGISTPQLGPVTIGPPKRPPLPPERPVLARPLQLPGRPFRIVEIMVLMAGLPLVAIMLIQLVAPSLVQNSILRYLWGDLPLVAVVAPCLHAAYKKNLWITTGGYIATVVIGGLVSGFAVNLKNPIWQYQLIVAAIVSAAVIGVLTAVTMQKWQNSNRSREVITSALISTFGSAVLYLIDFGYIPTLIWTAPILGGLGWILGERVLRAIIYRRDPGG